MSDDTDLKQFLDAVGEKLPNTAIWLGGYINSLRAQLAEAEKRIEEADLTIARLKMQVEGFKAMQKALAEDLRVLSLQKQEAEKRAYDKVIAEFKTSIALADYLDAEEKEGNKKP